jgi:hypothetical protein
LEFYVQTIKELLRPERKLLHFEEESRLLGYMMSITAENMGDPAAKYPPIAALGYAVSALWLWREDGQQTYDRTDDGGFLFG